MNKIVQKLPPCARGGVVEYARQFLRLQRECRPADLIEQVIGRVWGWNVPGDRQTLKGEVTSMKTSHSAHLKPNKAWREHPKLPLAM